MRLICRLDGLTMGGVCYKAGEEIVLADHVEALKPYALGRKKHPAGDIVDYTRDDAPPPRRKHLVTDSVAPTPAEAEQPTEVQSESQG